MPRTKTPVTATVYAVGSLVSLSGDPDTLFMDARTDDNRRVFIGFKTSEWAVNAKGKNVSEAERMRTLAETLLRAAEKLEMQPDNRECRECGLVLRYSHYTNRWHTGAHIRCVTPDGYHVPKD